MSQFFNNNFFKIYRWTHICLVLIWNDVYLRLNSCDLLTTFKFCIVFFFLCLSFHAILTSECLRDFHFPVHLSAFPPAVLVISKSHKKMLHKWPYNTMWFETKGDCTGHRHEVFILGCSIYLESKELSDSFFFHKNNENFGCHLQQWF